MERKKVGRNCRRKCFEKKSFLFPSATFFQRTHTQFFIYLLAFCSIHKAFWVGKIIVVFLSVLFLFLKHLMFTFLILFHLEVFHNNSSCLHNFKGERWQEFLKSFLLPTNEWSILIIILLFLKAITGFSTHHPTGRGKSFRRNLEPNNIIIMLPFTDSDGEWESSSQIFS